MYPLRIVSKFRLIFRILLNSPFLKKVVPSSNLRFFEHVAINCMEIDHLLFAFVNTDSLIRMGLFFKAFIIQIDETLLPMV